MSGKSLNGNRNGNSPPATLSPGDFPLGSMQSRAAARSMLAKFGMPQDDADALHLFGGAVLLNAQMDPSYQELELTAAYARGKELSENSDTPGADFDSGDSSVTWKIFRMAFGRSPATNDLLRYEDVKVVQSPVWHAWHVKQFIAAWNRQIPGLPCPLTVEEDKRVFRRLGPTAIKENHGQEWEEDLDHLHAAKNAWRIIEREAQGGAGVRQHADQIPTIEGVIFTGSRWRPATKKELQEVETEPSGGLSGLLATAAIRIGEGAQQ